MLKEVRSNNIKVNRNIGGAYGRRLKNFYQQLKRSEEWIEPSWARGSGSLEEQLNQVIDNTDMPNREAEFVRLALLMVN